VDIDLKLYMAQDSSDTYEEVAAAQNGIYNEEVIVYKLVPTIVMGSTNVHVRYKLKILFWKWNSAQVPKCSTFNMELAVTPLSMGGRVGENCPNGG